MPRKTPSTANAVPLLSQEKANLTHSSVNSFIKNLLSEAHSQLPSPVGEGAELAEADEVFWRNVTQASLV